MKIKIESKFTNLNLMIKDFQEDTSGREGFDITVRDEKNQVIEEIIILESGIGDGRVEILHINR